MDGGEGERVEGFAGSAGFRMFEVVRRRSSW